MSSKTMIYANELEQRLENGRKLIETQEDEATRDRALAAYDTAVDMATCYRMPEGDIWSTETPTQKGRYMVCRGDKRKVNFAYWDGEGWKNGKTSIDNVYAWAYVPSAPKE